MDLIIINYYQFNKLIKFYYYLLFDANDDNNDNSGNTTVRIIYTQKLKFLKYYVIHTLDFKKITTIQFSFKKGVY